MVAGTLRADMGERLHTWMFEHDADNRTKSPRSWCSGRGEPCHHVREPAAAAASKSQGSTTVMKSSIQASPERVRLFAARAPLLFRCGLFGPTARTSGPMLGRTLRK
jgi:hypothetical protein